MRPTRTLPLALPLAALAAIAGCSELIDARSGPVAQADVEANGEILDIVHSVRSRIELTISTTDPLLPGEDVTLTVRGVAREPIDGGEVVLTLPTRALMDHDGTAALPELPAVARWELPPMAVGDVWRGRHTLPGEAEGRYRALANAYTHGPGDGDPWLFDDALDDAWMHIHETDGRLARWFEDTILPEGVHPVAGPAAGWPTAAGADTSRTELHLDSVYLKLVYTVSEREGFKPAAGAFVQAWLKPTGPGRNIPRGTAVVPKDGVVAFLCPKKNNDKVVGESHALDTKLVQGRDDIAFWATTRHHCGKMVQVEVEDQKYYPWRLLNLAADTLQKHFGHTRGRINWKLRDGGHSQYQSFPEEKILLGWEPADARFFWVVAHEYGHALHNKALNGLWHSPKCGRDDRKGITTVTSYRCALQEGFADYAGTVGSVTAEDPSGYYGKCFEHLGTSEAPQKWCRNVSHNDKPKVEAWVAALFMDLIDDNGNDEKNDETEFSGHYVAKVFKSCEIERRYRFRPDDWKKRERVADLVWCLEGLVHEPTHEDAFPGYDAPDSVKHNAGKPDGWDPFNIRRTWLKNLTKEGK